MNQPTTPGGRTQPTMPTKPCPHCGDAMPAARGVCPACGGMTTWFKVRLSLGCISISLAFGGILVMLWLALQASN